MNAQLVNAPENTPTTLFEEMLFHPPTPQYGGQSKGQTIAYCIPNHIS
jgi:hypothetical protein